jgi:hypothetical protein
MYESVKRALEYRKMKEKEKRKGAKCSTPKRNSK